MGVSPSAPPCRRADRGVVKPITTGAAGDRKRPRYFTFKQFSLSLLPLRRRGSAQIGDRSARKSVKARRPLRRERFVEFPEVSRLHADACASRRHRRPAHATPERPSARRSSPSSQDEAVSHETGGTPIIP